MSWKHYHRCKDKVSAMNKMRACQIVRSPWVTEKSTRLGENRQSTFLVAVDATKPEIKAAIELLFSVQVVHVTTLVAKPKTKRFRGRLGTRVKTKKAVVRVASGQTLDIAQPVS